MANNDFPNLLRYLEFYAHMNNGGKVTREVNWPKDAEEYEKLAALMTDKDYDDLYAEHDSRDPYDLMAWFWKNEIITG